MNHEPLAVYAFRGDSDTQLAYRENIATDPELHAEALSRYLGGCASGDVIVRGSDVRFYGEALAAVQGHLEPESWQLLAKTLVKCVENPRYEAWKSLLEKDN